MPITIRGTTDARSGRLAVALGALSASVLGTAVAPAARNGRLVAPLGGLTLRLRGQASAPATRNGRITTTLGTLRASVRGTFVAAGQRNGRIVSALGGVSASLRGTYGPGWTTMPTVTFIQGLASNFDLLPYFGPDSASLTKNALAFHLNSGITFNAAAKRFEYVATGVVGGTNGHILTADDGGVVNLQPVWQASVNQTLTEDAPFSLNLDTLCSDPESQPLTYTILNPPLPAWLTQSGARGEILSGTPPDTSGSPFTLNIRATD